MPTVSFYFLTLGRWKSRSCFVIFVLAVMLGNRDSTNQNLESGQGRAIPIEPYREALLPLPSSPN